MRLASDELVEVDAAAHFREVDVDARQRRQPRPALPLLVVPAGGGARLSPLPPSRLLQHRRENRASHLHRRPRPRRTLFDPEPLQL